MRLDFEDNGELIQQLAETAAKAYCNICKNHSEYDNALCDAYLFVVEVEFDDGRSESERNQFIVRRVTGRLIDEYRKHNRKRDQDFDLTSVATEEKKEKSDERIVNIEDALSFIKRAMKICYPVTKNRTTLNDKERGIIFDYVLLKTMDKKKRPKSPLLEVARKHGVTQGRASQILKVFSRRYDLIRAGIHKCVIIETRYENPTRSQIESTPLFYDF